MKHENISLATSNARKIAEFKSFGLPFNVVKGADLKEVSGTINEVILHKAMDAGEGVLVEDTVLLINGEEIVDIRWKLEELAKMKNPNILWITSLGILDNGIVSVYRGQIDCALVRGASDLVVPEDAFGFDPYLAPLLSGIEFPQTFYELDKDGNKTDFSPRKYAVEVLLSGIPSLEVEASSIAAWEGDYQGS